MKKIKKFIRFLLILSVCFVFFTYVGRIVSVFLWNFDILSSKPYISLYLFWENGGVFNSFRDITLILYLFFLPIFFWKSICLLYKKGFWKTVLTPFVKIYTRLTRPNNMEVEHVSIKNLGAKDKSIDEIISDKLKQKGETHNNTNSVTRNLRQQVAEKIKENENK